MLALSTLPYGFMTRELLLTHTHTHTTHARGVNEGIHKKKY